MQIPKNMTVRELVRLLAQFPGDTPILVDGYESGLDEVVNVRHILAAKVEVGSGFEGEYVERKHFWEGGFWAVHIGARP